MRGVPKPKRHPPPPPGLPSFHFFVQNLGMEKLLKLCTCDRRHSRRAGFSEVCCFACHFKAFSGPLGYQRHTPDRGRGVGALEPQRELSLQLPYRRDAKWAVLPSLGPAQGRGRYLKVTKTHRLATWEWGVYWLLERLSARGTLPQRTSP